MKNETNPADLQELLNYWGVTKYENLKKGVRIYKIKKNKFKLKIQRLRIKDQISKIEKIYYATKAIQNKADTDLPFNTLILLGQLLKDPNYSDEIKNIIDQNVIKCSGVFYKLNDLENQVQVRKILRTYQFEKLDQLRAA
jgi:hypothetical protein